MYPELPESQRFPLLTDQGRRLLHRLAEDPNAPVWHWPCGDQLNAAGLEQVRAFARRLDVPPGDPGAAPDWLGPFADFCLREVPFYRRQGPVSGPFSEWPTFTRAELAREPWAFVPDGQPLDELLVFRTSGTSGHPARILSHPTTAATGLPLLEQALARHSVRLARGADRVALMTVCAFEGAYTGPLVLSYLDEAGYARINLVPGAWRRPTDAAQFLDRWRPPVFSSDPLALAELARLPLGYRPEAIISSALTLSPAFAGRLAEQFGCPVLDVYAISEAGIVALQVGAGYEVLAPDLYVEVLDDDDNPCPPGQRGEITLTGGRNPFLPLLRYRTGDFAALERVGGRLLLVGLEGRPPCLFRRVDGGTVHSMEVSRALRPYPLVQFALHQEADGTLRFRYRGDVDLGRIEASLRSLFGSGCALQSEELPSAPVGRGKVVQYTSAVALP